MSKRAEKTQASAILPESIISYAKEHAVLSGLVYREGVKYGYEQAEKDTIERAVEWLKVHAKDYIVNMTGSYPDAPFDAIIGGKCWDELKKAMEEE